MPNYWGINRPMPMGDVLGSLYLEHPLRKSSFPIRVTPSHSSTTLPPERGFFCFGPKLSYPFILLTVSSFLFERRRRSSPGDGQVVIAQQRWLSGCSSGSTKLVSASATTQAHPAFTLMLLRPSQCRCHSYSLPALAIVVGFSNGLCDSRNS